MPTPRESRLNKLSTIVAAISAALAIASIILWSRSFFRDVEYDRFTYHGNTRACHLIFQPNKVLIWLVPGTRHDDDFHWDSSFAVNDGYASRVLKPDDNGWWFTSEMEWADSGKMFIEVTIPAWIICVLTLLLPIRWLARNKPWHRQTFSNYCSQCGYDLRFSPDRCPECGTARIVKQ